MAARDRAGVPGSGEFLELVAQMSSRLINVATAEVETEVEAALRCLATFFDLDRCALFKVDDDRRIARVVHRLKPVHKLPLPTELGRDGPLAWLYGAVVDRGETVSIGSLDELPPAAIKDAEILRQGGVRSALLIPLPAPLPVEYFLSLASSRQERHLTATHTAQLRLLGEVFVGAIKRKTLEEGQFDALRFEHVISDVLSGFARVDPDQLDQQIQATLEELLAFAQVEHFGIFAVDQETGWVQLTHSARAEGVPAVPMSYDFSSGAPWLYEQLVRGRETFSFARLDEFPPAAAADRTLIESRGTRSGLYIPLQVDGKVRQILAVVSRRGERSWPSRFVERLKALGEVIVTAINHKAIAAERLRSESNLAEAQRIANLGSWEWDMAADKVTTSEQCDRIQGFRFRKFDDFIAAIHPHDRDAVRRKVEQDMAPPYSNGILEYRILRPDGGERFVRDVYEFVLDADGRPARVIGTIQDITEQTLMRQRVRWAQQFTQSTLNAFHKCLCVVDAGGTVVQVSDGWPAFAQASGWADLSAGGDFFGAAATQGPCAAQARKVADGVRAVVDRLQYELAMELAFDGPAGTRHFYTKVNRFELEGVAYAAISHEDITQRKNSEIELQNLRTQHWHSERVTQTGLLIASLAHELSQPLTAILSNAQAGLRFMARDQPDLKEIGEILRDIASDDKRAGEIIESLRVMLRRQQSERQLIDLAALAGEVTILLRSEFVAAQIELECDFAAGCLARVDRAQIQQVLLNLSMNAMEAMVAKASGQRRLRIGVCQAGQGEVQFSVSDSGLGITQEEFRMIFDAFWTTKSRGTGMGLAISRSIIESHGGRIWVDSRGGEGSTFFVSLPAAAKAASDGSLPRA